MVKWGSASPDAELAGGMSRRISDIPVNSWPLTPESLNFRRMQNSISKRSRLRTTSAANSSGPTFSRSKVYAMATALSIATSLTYSTAGKLEAQSSRGPTEDAAVLKKGVLEVDFGADWRSAYDRYKSNGSSKTEPLGKRWSLDSITASTFPILTPIQNLVRTLTGLSNAAVSLGGTSTKLTQRTTTVPIAFSAGVTKRLTVGVTVPLVQVESDVLFTTKDANSSSANISFNPALGNSSIFASDTMFINEMQRAAAGVRNYCAGAGAGTTECTSAANLPDQAEEFASALNGVYAQGAFAPLQGSDLHNAVVARSQTYIDQLNVFAAIGGSGVPAITATGVSPATLPIATPELQFLIQSADFGLRADSIASLKRWNLGDIRINAKFLVFDGISSETQTQSNFRTRLSAGASLRLPTGHIPSSANYFDLSSGIDAVGVGVEGYFDFLYGKKMLTSIVAKYDVNFESTVATRIWDTPQQSFLEDFRTATVDRKIGNALQFQITPKYLINEFISLGLNYTLLNKQKDSYSGATVTIPAGDSTGGVDVILNPSTMANESGYTDHRVGAGFSFSNLKSYSEGKARIPFEVSYYRSQSISGSGGYFAKQNQDMIKMKLYIQVF